MIRILKQEHIYEMITKTYEMIQRVATYDKITSCSIKQLNNITHRKIKAYQIITMTCDY